ncbi:MAG: pyruvate synthase subunit PorD [Euryarchaeota archaeon]|nr:pyruvate synthase subunit PorD [Euryarchaeota archaeon]
MVKITLGAINKVPGSSKNYKTGSWRTLKPEIDREKCKKCWICYKYCPEGCIAKKDNGPAFDYDYCKGCGICAEECPFDAIKMVKEEK